MICLQLLIFHIFFIFSSLQREKSYINQLGQTIFKTTKLPQICKLKEIGDCNIQFGQ